MRLLRMKAEYIWLLSAIVGGSAFAASTYAESWQADTFLKEPMNTVVKQIDGVNVVYQYGKPVPSFDTWDSQVPARNYISLDGKWRFAFDPQNQGLSEGWHQLSYDDTVWNLEKVPGSWDLYDTPGFGTYDGSHYGVGSAFQDGYAWYRTHVTPDSNWKHKFIRLNFLGAGYKTWVYVNGKFVGAHEGGHTPFSLDVSDQLLLGKDNVIAVRVYRLPGYDSYTKTNPTPIRSETGIPPGPVDYWPYAGITRSVYLEVSSQVTVSKLLTVAKDNRLHLAAVLCNHGNIGESRLVAADPGAQTGGSVQTAEVRMLPGEVKVVQFDIPIPEAQIWDTATPSLYEATVTLYKGKGLGQLHDGKSSVDDQLSVRYGMRTIEVKNGKLLLNGRQVFLKGVNWHEETAASGRSMSIDEYDVELGMLSDLQANFIRNSVYNRHPYVYEYADRHGLLVLDDIDNMWVGMKEEKLQTESYGLSKALALMMAWNQADSPSVIMWSLQNESDIWTNRSVYRNWIADMKQAVNSVDLQSRPVTWASSSSWDPAFDLADVIGFNEYFGYFYGKNSDLGPTLDTVHKQYPDKPILITENGSWSFFGRHGSVDQGGTEEWHANNFQLHWDQVVQRKDFMAGYTFWNLKDYKQRSNYNKEYNGMSFMGTVTFDDETPRLVYYRFRNAVNPAP